MMMPANFSAIAESEMTYVVGGAGLVEALGAVTAPIWNADNVKTFNTNLIQIVGNSFVQPVVAGTLGVMFGGKWGTKTGEKNGDKDVRYSIFGKKSPVGLWTTLDPNGKTETTNGFNKFMIGLGALAGIYTMGTTSTKSYVKETTLGIGGVGV